MASTCPTAPSTNGRRSTRQRLSRTSGWARSWPTSPSSKRSSTCPVRPRRRGDVARRIICSRSDRWYTRASRCAIWKLHTTPSREPGINPNPQKGGYPAPDRVTFLNSPNRDFPKRRRHVLPGILCPSVLDGSPETQLSYRLGDLGRIFLVGLSSTERTDDHYFPEQRLSLTAASVSLLATSRGTQALRRGA